MSLILFLSLVFIVIADFPTATPKFEDRNDWSNLNYLKYLECCDCGLVHEIFFLEEGQDNYIAFDRDQKRTEQARLDPNGILLNNIKNIGSIIELVSNLQEMFSRNLDVQIDRFTRDNNERIEIKTFMSLMLSPNITVEDSNQTVWTLEERCELARKILNWQAKQRDPNGFYFLYDSIHIDLTPLDPNHTFYF